MQSLVKYWEVGYSLVLMAGVFTLVILLLIFATTLWYKNMVKRNQKYLDEKDRYRYL